MTRFARADGSKGSNKREEEEATPWNVLVQQMRGKTGGGGIEDEEEDYIVSDQPQDDFPKRKTDVVRHGSDDSGVEEEDEIDTRLLDQDSDEEEEKENDDDEVIGNILEANSSLKRPAPTLVSSEEPKKKKRKKSVKCKVCGDKSHWKKDCPQVPEERRQELQELYTLKVDRKGKGTGRKKNKNKLANILKESEGNDDITDGKPCGENQNRSPKKFGKNLKTVKQDRSGATIEEGEVLFQGFRVTKEDQVRLKKLHKKLRSSGATKPEIDEALKRERRRAEKSLARSKKLVCFNCREPGHVLADCPVTDNVKVDTMPSAAGHCFKCGSLEHTSKDCKSKLKRENAYRFAVCFICKQEGHLAKACPDNPKGLYPNGGGCVFCGSVEHLKRDCPRKVEKDVKQGVRVGVMGDTGLEEEPVHSMVRAKKKEKKMKKVVVF